ncbi:MAG: hypothetical protein SXQ77_05505, partial [Halobacteria archaeon]|nr:hypothetical protein [Halobacteria archaeon]
EMGGNGNISTIISALEDELSARDYDYTNPWYFPRLGEYTSLLENTGFEVRYARLFDRPTRLKGDDGLRNWLEMFGDTFFAEVPGDEADEIIDAVEDELRDELYDAENGDWVADYRRLRFVAY